jgi:hypothetical protein
MAGHAPHEAWVWIGPVAVGRRATVASLNQFRRLRVRYEKRADIHQAFLSLGLSADLLAVSAKEPDDGLSGSPEWLESSAPDVFAWRI